MDGLRQGFFKFLLDWLLGSLKEVTPYNHSNAMLAAGFSGSLPDHQTVLVAFGLGCVRVATFILIKKLLFAFSILRLDVKSIIRSVFIED